MLILLDTYSLSSEINTQVAFRVATSLRSEIEVFYQEGVEFVALRAINL